MRRKKVTDLEKFTLTHIYRPYWSIIGEGDNLKRLGGAYKLDNALERLNENLRWANFVLGRIKAIGFYFPDYIQHPLVSFLRKMMRTKG